MIPPFWSIPPAGNSPRWPRAFCSSPPKQSLPNRRDKDDGRKVMMHSCVMIATLRGKTLKCECQGSLAGARLLRRHCWCAPLAEARGIDNHWLAPALSLSSSSFPIQPFSCAARTKDCLHHVCTYTTTDSTRQMSRDERQPPPMWTLACRWTF